MDPSWIEFGSKDNIFAIHDLGEDNTPNSSRMLLSYSTTDVAGLRLFLEAKGTACSPIHDRERGRYFTCTDPADNRLAAVKTLSKANRFDMNI